MIKLVTEILVHNEKTTAKSYQAQKLKSILNMKKVKDNKLLAMI